MFNLDKVVYKRSANNNPKSFLSGVPAIFIAAKKEKGTNKIEFNREAIELIGDNRIVFFPEYQVSESETKAIFVITKESKLRAGKNWRSYTLNTNTAKVTSNEIYEGIVGKFELDVACAYTLTITPKDGFFIVELYNRPVCDEGKDVVVSDNEEEFIEMAGTDAHLLNNLD